MLRHMHPRAGARVASRGHKQPLANVSSWEAAGPAGDIVHTCGSIRYRHQTELPMHSRLVLAVCTSLLVISAARAAEVPAAEQVQEWWKAKSSEEMTIEGPLQEVHLRNKEVAFLVPVGFYQRGRNFIWHTVLVRPELREVRELPAPVGRECSVRDVDAEGVSEVMSVAVASGGGTTESVQSIFELDGFNPVVMHQAVSRDNLGACHEGCKQVDVTWKFDRPAGHAQTTLVETVTTSTGPTPERLRSTNVVKRYVRDGDTFVPTSPQATGRSNSRRPSLP